MAEDKPKEQCPACGKYYGVPYLYQHMREVHQQWGGRTGRLRRTPPHQGRDLRGGPQSTVTDEEALERIRALPGALTPAQSNGTKKMSFKRIDNMIMLQDQDGGLWVAEKIRD